MSTAVTTVGLTRRFGRQVAVDHVDLEIQTGELFGLVGPNGAGKTTLIRILCALLDYDAGSVRVLTFDPARDAKYIRPQIGYMSQAFSLYQSLTVAENLRFYGDLYGRVSTSRLHEICELVDLRKADIAHIVADLPTGVRQRAALAAAVLHNPRLIFLDEPTSGVDPAGRREFWELIHTLAKTGTTIIVSTHVMTEAERCDRVALMMGGRVLACDSPGALRASTGLQVAVVEARPWQRAYAVLAGHYPGTSLRGTAVHVPMPRDAVPSDALARDLADVEVSRVAIAQPSFEDAFIWLIHDNEQKR
jgi:ABC-2 type transport system ATP-binding protein